MSTDQSGSELKSELEKKPIFQFVLYLLRSPYWSSSRRLGLIGTTTGSRQLTTLAYSQSQILTTYAWLPTAGEQRAM